MPPTLDRSADVLLIGGGVASARCARALRRGGFTGAILLAGAEPLPPYNRPPLSKELLRDELPDELLLAEPMSWYERRDVGLLTGVEVVALDPAARRATLDDGSQIGFERCLIATGASPRSLPVPGGERALLLRTLADARRLRDAALAAGPGASVVVVGGGLIGVEVASGLAALGLRPTVVELATTLWGGAMGAELSEWGLARLRDAGVEVRLGASVSRLEPGAAWVGEERLACAFVVAGVGVRPRDDLAASAGLRVADGIVVDASQRTSNAAVWAAGDVARVDGRRVEHWHAAREAGERAALSMLGGDVPEVPVPWTFTEVGGVSLDVFGSASEADEEEWIGESVVASVQAGRVVQLGVIGSTIRADEARRLIGASMAEVQQAFDR